MKLARLVEMIQEDSNGAEEWPVLFTSYLQNASGEWREVEGVRQPIASVAVEEGAEEVLLIKNSDRAPLPVKMLMEELKSLMTRYSDFTVDCCETPIVLDDGATIHIDFPVVGTGRDERNRCYLVLYASKVSS